MHNLLIYNPVSGRTNLRLERIGRIIFELTNSGNELTVYQTQSKIDIRNFIRTKDLARYNKIICYGGDGTLHEVVNGLIESGADRPLGYIPAGSTNDYAKNLGINERTAIDCIKKGLMKTVDIGRFGEEYFNYIAAFGAFTNVSFLTPQKSKNALGYLAYLLEGVRHLSDIKPYHVKFDIDGVIIEDNVVVGMMTNAFSVAGVRNKRGADIYLDDGKMEYVLIKMPDNVLEIQTIVTLLLSSKVDARFMYYGQFKKMKIFSEPMQWTLDGENGGVFEKVEIKVCYRQLNMFVKGLGENAEG